MAVIALMTCFRWNNCDVKSRPELKRVIAVVAVSIYLHEMLSLLYLFSSLYMLSSFEYIFVVMRMFSL